MRKLLGLMGAIGLVASTGVTSVVSCGDTPEKDSAQLTVLKDAVNIALKDKTFKTNDEAIAAIEGVSGTGIVAFDKDGKAVAAKDSITISKVEISSDQKSAKVSFKESISNPDYVAPKTLSDDTTKNTTDEFIWGTEGNFSVNVTIKADDVVVKTVDMDAVKTKVTSELKLDTVAYADVAAVNTAVSKIKIDGIKSISAAAKTSSLNEDAAVDAPFSVTITVALADGYSIKEGQSLSFDIDVHTVIGK